MNFFHKTVALLSLGALATTGPAHAAQLYLVSKIVGKVNTRADSGKETSLGQADWLPANTRIFTRARSGVEALAPGFSLRFGEDTAFSIGDRNLQLHKGAMLLRTLGSGKQLALEGPEASVWLQGEGSCLLEVATNGGFKVIGLTGKPAFALAEGTKGRVAHPGELLFVKPLDGGWSDPVNIHLSKLVPSAFLLRGFPNTASYQDEVTRSVQTQTDLITKTFRAVVGDARGTDSFEVKVRPDTTTGSTKPAASDSSVEETESGEYLSATALPSVPGPPLQFHTPADRVPTLKEVFGKETKPSAPSFPGKLLNP